MNGIGERIAWKRAALKPPMSQKALVKRMQSSGVDITLERLSSIEQGKAAPLKIELLALAELLKTSVHWLMTGAGK